MACLARISKPRPRKTGLSSIERKQQLAAAIDCFGTVAPTPCGSCVRHEEAECRLWLCSGRCSHCSRHGRKCSLIVSHQEWNALKSERQQLCHQIDDVDRDLQKLLQKRVDLRKRWDALEDRTGEAIAREQVNIDQLEHLELVQTAHEQTSGRQESAVQETLPQNAQTAVNFDCFGFGSPIDFDLALEGRL